MIQLLRTIWQDNLFILRSLGRYRQILFATAWIEIRKRYAGSLLGRFWIVLYPLLILSVYLFVYLVVFKVRFPGYSEMDYVLYVFAGLVPYMGVSEAIQAGTGSIKQNIHLVKNVMLPIEIVPVRAVLTALAGQVISLLVVAALSVANHMFTPMLLALPVVFVLQLLFLWGAVFILSAMAMVIQDIGYFVNILMMLLMFLSPIGFRADMVPENFQFIVWMNPVSYLCDAYRYVLLSDQIMPYQNMLIYAGYSIAVFVLGVGFFSRFKGILVDYE